MLMHFTNINESLMHFINFNDNAFQFLYYFQAKKELLNSSIMAIFGRTTFLIHSLSAVKIRTGLSIVLLDNKSADGDGHTN